MELKDELRLYEQGVINVLKTIYDPEVPVNIYDLGLIYKIRVNEDFTVNIEMTLTAPNCPVAESLPEEVREKVSNMVGIKNATVEIVFEPPWDKEMMSEEAKLDLGFL